VVRWARGGRRDLVRGLERDRRRGRRRGERRTARASGHRLANPLAREPRGWPGTAGEAGRLVSDRLVGNAPTASAMAGIPNSGTQPRSPRGTNQYSPGPLGMPRNAHHRRRRRCRHHHHRHHHPRYLQRPRRSRLIRHSVHRRAKTCQCLFSARLFSLPAPLA
jgi:hypothetical protein